MRDITKRIAKAFSRAAKTYDDHAVLQQSIGDKLITLLPTKHYHHVLDAGCGTGFTTEKLLNHISYQTAHAIDIAQAFLSIAKSRLHNIDVSHADLNYYSNPNTFSLIFSNMALQWCADLPTTVNNLAASLKPNGLLAFSLPLNGSLTEISSFANTHPLPDLTHVTNELAALNLHLHASTVMTYEETYSNKLAALKSIKNCGANFTTNRAKTKLSYSFLTKPELINLTYHIGFFVAEKRHD